MGRLKFHLTAQSIERLGLTVPLPGATKCPDQTLRVRGGPQQMGGFHYGRQFIRPNERHVSAALAANNDDFLIRGDSVQHGCKFIAELGIGCFHFFYRTGALYADSITYNLRMFLARLFLAELCLSAAFWLHGADTLDLKKLTSVKPDRTVATVGLPEQDRKLLKIALVELMHSLDDVRPHDADSDDPTALLRMTLVDLNRDHVPEVIVQATGLFWCSPTGNCPYWVFGKDGNRYRSLMGKDPFPDVYQSVALGARHGGYRDLIGFQHDSRTRQAITIYQFRGKGYEPVECYEADWSVPGDDFAAAKEPRITRCGVQR